MKKDVVNHPLLAQLCTKVSLKNRNRDIGFVKPKPRFFNKTNPNRTEIQKSVFAHPYRLIVFSLLP
jgi:hypothetical protein